MKTYKINKKNNEGIMKDKVFFFGQGNDWKGFIGLYFSKKELRQIAKEVGIKAKDIEEYRLVDVYALYS